MMAKQDSEAEVGGPKSPTGGTLERRGTDILVALGVGVRVGVRNGCLHIADRLGRHRRERSWAPGGCDLRRIVVGARSGIVTVDAIAWCHGQGVALVVVDEEGTVMLGPGDYGQEEAPLRRAQATASEEFVVSVASELIRAKIVRQAVVAEGALGRPDVSATLRAVVALLANSTSLSEVRRIEATATASYFAAWIQHPAVVPRFTSSSAKHVPPHWCHYDRRRSIMTRSKPIWKAERPTNTVLNYLYRIAAIEARLTCIAVGLAPGLGVLLRDASARDSLALDILEPVRPEIDQFVLDLMAKTTFSRNDFFEQSDGSVRLGTVLAERLEATTPLWSDALTPFAEHIARAYGELVTSESSPPSHTERRNSRIGAAIAGDRSATHSHSGSQNGIQPISL